MNYAFLKNNIKNLKMISIGGNVPMKKIEVFTMAQRNLNESLMNAQNIQNNLPSSNLEILEKNFVNKIKETNGHEKLNELIINLCNFERHKDDAIDFLKEI